MSKQLPQKLNVFVENYEAKNTDQIVSIPINCNFPIRRLNVDFQFSSPANATIGNDIDLIVNLRTDLIGSGIISNCLTMNRVNNHTEFLFNPPLEVRGLYNFWLTSTSSTGIVAPLNIAVPSRFIAKLELSDS